MMKKSLFKKIMYPALGATSTMTGFSYLASHLFNEQFKEPKLLSSLFFSPGRQKSNKPPVGGFLLHYLVGMIFATVYQLFWKRIFRFPKWKDGLIYGAVCGLIGMLTWKLTFTLHKSPPDIKLKSYLFHLLIAHLIFGVTLTWTDRKLRSKS